MDRCGISAETPRRTKARTEPCSATEGLPDADRLSALSDELLLHILSFLDMQEVVSTSCLSRRWRFLYHNVASLDFSADFDHDSACHIDRVLLLHTAPRIEVFRLSMSVEGEDSFACRQIDSWLLLAVRRGVRVLDLDIPVGDRDERCYSDEPCYRLPPWVFHCTTLEDLSVEQCHLCPLPSHVRLVSLKKMCLSLIEFQDDELKRLLLGCPLLQNLKLVDCNRGNDLVIDALGSRNLEELVIFDGFHDHERDPPEGDVELQIYAPTVKYLTLDLDVHGLTRKYKVRDLSSVVVASFSLDDSGRVLYVNEAYAFATGLLLRIPKVRVLNLCRLSLQALFRKELGGYLDSELPGVTTLELTMGLYKEEMPAILSALRACNKLRTLVLSIVRTEMLEFYDRDLDETESPQLHAHNSDSVMQDLKTIVIQGLKRDNFKALGKEIDIVLIGFLLQVSPVLEKLIVQPSKGMDGMPRKWELLFNLLSELISLPRVSPKAQVIIDQDSEVKEED